MPEHSINIVVEGREVRTLADILPTTPGLQILFVAKTPAPVSVKAGHYFQGTQGRMFWNRLIEYELFKPTTPFEDDSLLDHHYGLTDIVKVPRGYGNEPSDAEYAAGTKRILQLVKTHRPKVVVFVYKRVLDQVLRFGLGVTEKSVYGFNPPLQSLFASQVFSFPMPGTPCNSDQAASAMQELTDLIMKKP